MNKVIAVARREYLYNLRRRSFLFAVFGVPIFTFVMWFIIFAVVAGNEENLDQVGSVGYVDEAGILENPVYPQDAPDLFTPYATEEAARAALDAREIGAYVLVPENYLRTGQVQTYSFSGVPEALRDSIESFMLANVTRLAGENVPVERIEQPVDLSIRIADSGRVLTEANIPALFFIPMIFAFVFLMASSVTSGFLMNGVVEEKTNRIMEILVTSVTPGQLLLGKILGLGLLGLTQLVVWGVAGLLLIRFGQAIPLLAGLSFPTDLIVVLVIYFVLSYFLLASLMAGIGAVANSEEESRQWSSILSLIWVIPFFAITVLLEQPNGSLALALSLIPFTAPMTMLLRLGFAAVPAWQVILSIVILFLTCVFVVWASARVFRWALLLYGKRISPREIWRALRSGQQTATVEARAAKESV